MRHPVRRTSKLATVGFLIGIAFLFGLGVASSFDWTARSQAADNRLLSGSPARPPLTADVKRAAGLSEAFVSISDAVTQGVVRIQTERTAAYSGSGVLPRGLRGLFGDEEPGNDQAPPDIGGGSGFLVSPDGYILTNNHVIDGFDRISVTLLDRRTYDAEIVGRDPTTDVAVIKIAAKDLPYVRMGNSDDARVGEWVIAIGNPGFADAASLDFTVTSGIISAKGRPLQLLNTELQAESSPAASYAIEDFIQTDAVINPGNSGGPLVNLRGEVIGINTAIASPTGFYQGYGFAIPSNLAQRVMTDLVANGRVRRALLGVSISDVSPEDAELYKLDRIAGVRVDDFAEDAPARRAGLQRHDVIVAVNGQRVERVGQLQRLVAQHRPGESVRISVIRYGAEKEFEIRLTEAPLAEEPVARRAARRLTVHDGTDLGMEVTDVTAAVARRFDLEGSGAALVARVEPFSPAARKGVETGDRIIEVNQQPVGSAREAGTLLRAIGSGEIVSLLLRSPSNQTRIANIRVP